MICWKRRCFTAKVFIWGNRYCKGIYMTETRFPYLIAIDGGGTSCRFVLDMPDGREALTLGSANVFSAFDEALATLVSGLEQLADRSGLERDVFWRIPVYAGLAGITDRASAELVEQRLPSSVLLVEDDRRSAVVGALGKRTGAVIGIGTGSFLARQTANGITFLGGYGADLGDEASGNWLGRALLRRALHVLDGMSPTSPLIEQCLSGFGHDAHRIVAFSATASPADYGSLAPDIVEAAKQGDPVGRELTLIGARYISDGLFALGHQPGEAICALGGLAACYEPYLSDEIKADFTDPTGSALDGALLLAREFAQAHAQEAV